MTSDCKMCRRCGQPKPLSDFSQSWVTRGERRYLQISSKCKPCKREAYTRTPEMRVREAEYRRIKFSDPVVKSKMQETQRRNYVLRAYGITLEQKEEILERQGGVCAACGRTEHNGRGWHVDHDHSCCPGGKTCGNCIRGILCHNCNLTLGLMADDVEKLLELAEYLESHS